MKTKDTNEDADSNKSDGSKVTRSKNSFQHYLDFVSRNFFEIALIKIVAIGFILKLFFWNSKNNLIDENSALTLIIGRDFSEGNFTINRSGFTHRGVLEQILVAPLSATGVNSTLLVQVVSVSFLALATFLLYRSFARTPYKNTMRLVGGALWVWPFVSVFNSSTLTGTFNLLILLQVSIFASAYYAARSLRSQRYFFIFSFLSGLALWLSPISLIFSLVCFWWILSSSDQLRKEKIKALLFFVLGSVGFWANSISNRFESFFSVYQKHVVKVEDGSVNAMSALLQLFGVKTTENEFLTSILGIGFNLIFFLCLIGLGFGLVIGIKTAYKTKRNDFAFLQLSVFISYIIFAIICTALSFEINSNLLILLVIPTIFIILNSSESKVIVSVLLTLMLVAGTISQVAFQRESASVNKKQVEDLAAVLNKSRIKRALASHEVAYPLVVQTDFKTNVTPFDANNFDLDRQKKIENSIEAIIIKDGVKAQTDVILCVQAFFKTGFEKSISGNYDIYFVPKENKKKAFEIARKCAAQQN